MGKIEDIENAVASLSADELAKFRAWFEEFDARRFDERIERDLGDGRLDRLVDEAIADHRAGRSREL